MDLFKELGKRFMDPNYRYLKEKESAEDIKNKDRSKSIKLNETNVDDKERKKLPCC